MAVDMYLSVDKAFTSGSDGTVAPDNATQARVTGFSLGASTTATTGNGAVAAKPTVSALNLTMSDASDMSTALLKSALNGTQHTYYLSLVKTGGTQNNNAKPFETFTFQNGFVSGFNEVGSTSDAPTDTVSIAFKSLSRSLTSATASGAPSATPTTVTYDAAANKVSAAYVASPADASATDDAPAPTNETFTFKSGSAQNIANVLGSQRGLAAVQEVAGDFSSLAAVIAAAQPSSDGTGTIITLPNQNTITLAGLSEKQIRADAGQFKHLLFG